MKRIYLDYAATSPVDPRVLKVMEPFFTKYFGNASTLYKEGKEAKIILENSREEIAKLINAKSEEVYFTSGGTESDNFALKGIVFAKKKGHIITSAIEHHAVLHPAEWLKNQGFDLTVLPVDKYGMINIEDLKNTIRKDTILVSIMHANNEIGTIEPIREIGKICRENNIYFHTDAVQSFGKIPIDVKKMNIDLLSVSSHKLYGPKGVGALFIRKGVRIDPLFHGGGHENGLRSGTENISGIVGFGKACSIARKEMKKEFKRETMLRDYLIKNVLEIEDSWLNGHPTKRLPNNAHFCFKFIEGEALVLKLDMKGISAATGSACSTTSLEPSHVLLAIGLKPHEAHGSLRLTIGRFTKKSDINYVLEVLPKIVKSLRKISPFKGRW
ncbi:MAG: cysteine desulfurase NifS [Candidatus Aenigmatarchaeota archaeon]